MAVSPTVEPVQMLGDAGVTATVTAGFTVITAVAVPVHPLAAVPVTVYVVVVVGLAKTAAPLDAFRPVAGVHTYVDAPEASNPIVWPAQIVAVVGDAVTDGLALTFTVTAAVVVFAQASVIVTVYVVVVTGEALNDCAVLTVVVPLLHE